MRTAAALVVGAAFLSACTTSTAVLTWHDAWKAEQAGDLDKAERGYTTAAELNPGLVGAECNRIRLMAAHPDRIAATQASLDKLLKAKAALPEVAVTGTVAALQDGKVEVARKRLDAARKLTDQDQPDVHAAMRAAQVRVLAAEGKFAEAITTSRAMDLSAQATADRELAAVVAWNARDTDTASRFATPGSEVGVWLAVSKADHAEVVARAERLDRSTASAGVLAMIAWSRVRLGDRAKAQDWLALAQTRDPLDVAVVQVTAAVALIDGQPSVARDALAAFVARSPAAPWSAWFDLGVAQLRLGDAPAARQSFVRAAALCPACAGAARNRDALALLLGEGP